MAHFGINIPSHFNVSAYSSISLTSFFKELQMKEKEDNIKDIACAMHDE
jgi:hypothetical protein